MLSTPLVLSSGTGEQVLLNRKHHVIVPGKTGQQPCSGEIYREVFFLEDFHELVVVGGPHFVGGIDDVGSREGTVAESGAHARDARVALVFNVGPAYVYEVVFCGKPHVCAKL